MGKRNYGTGHIYIKWGSYYGRWRTLDRRLVNRKLGKVRPVGQRSGGLTRVQAEREMARKREEEDRAPRRELRSQRSMRSPTAPAPKRSPIFAHAKRRKFISDNPVSEATRPGRQRVGDADPDLQFLTVAELEAVLRAIPDEVVIRKPKPTRRGRRGPAPPPPPDVLGPVLWVVILAAAMTGLRQSELLGLRWRDVDWVAQRIRERNT